MTTLTMGHKRWVLLNSDRVVNEIIAKRASVTHERPWFPVAGELVSKNLRLFLQRTMDWREGRSILHHLMHVTSYKAHGAIIERSSLELLRLYLDEPRLWYAHNYRFPLTVIYKIMTNRDLDKSTKLLEDLQMVTSTFLTSINTSFIDFFPSLARLPIFLQFWRPHWESLG
jgi:hypothetical protein